MAIASTGQIVGGFQGAEMVVHLADRYVNTSQSGGHTAQSSLNDAQVRMAPTYGGSVHEVAIDRGVNGFANLANAIRWSVRCSSGQQVSNESRHRSVQRYRRIQRPCPWSVRKEPKCAWRSGT